MISSIRKEVLRTCALNGVNNDSILVVVAFIAGATWGPTVTMTPVSNAKACEKLRGEVAWQIASIRQKNVQSGATISNNGNALKVVASASRDTGGY